MTHTPEKWYVGYDQEYDIDAGDDGRTIGYPTGRDEFNGTVFMVTGEDQVEIIAEHIRDEKTALRIAALWNMAEKLRLTTEEIEGIASDTNSEATVECFLGCPATNNLMKKYMRKQYGRTR